MRQPVGADTDGSVGGRASQPHDHHERHLAIGCRRHTGRPMQRHHVDRHAERRHDGIGDLRRDMLGRVDRRVWIGYGQRRHAGVVNDGSRWRVSIHIDWHGDAHRNVHGEDDLCRGCVRSASQECRHSRALTSSPTGR